MSKYCPHCGAEQKNQAIFCSLCGKPLPVGTELKTDTDNNTAPTKPAESPHEASWYQGRSFDDSQNAYAPMASPGHISNNRGAFPGTPAYEQQQRQQQQQQPKNGKGYVLPNGTIYYPKPPSYAPNIHSYIPPSYGQPSPEAAPARAASIHPVQAPIAQGTGPTAAEASPTDASTSFAASAASKKGNSKASKKVGIIALVFLSLAVIAILFLVITANNKRKLTATDLLYFNEHYTIDQLLQTYESPKKIQEEDGLQVYMYETRFTGKTCILKLYFYENAFVLGKVIPADGDRNSDSVHAFLTDKLGEPVAYLDDLGFTWRHPTGQESNAVIYSFTDEDNSMFGNDVGGSEIGSTNTPKYSLEIPAAPVTMELVDFLNMDSTLSLAEVVSRYGEPTDITDSTRQTQTYVYENISLNDEVGVLTVTFINLDNSYDYRVERAQWHVDYPSSFTYIDDLSQAISEELGSPSHSNMTPTSSTYTEFWGPREGRGYQYHAYHFYNNDYKTMSITLTNFV